MSEYPTEKAIKQKTILKLPENEWCKQKML
jgi:hypothetical protein